MPEYIERESLVEDIKQYCHARIDNDAIAKMGYDFVKEMGLIQRIIEKAPAADVVEVVRCKDCEYGEADYGWDGKIITPFQYRCNYEDTWNRPDHYCGYGKKKEGAEE